MARLRIGSRGSQLALWQADHVASQVRGRGHEIEIIVIKTTGDKVLDIALSQVGTKGMFTKEIEEALLDGRIDLAVHSLKDVPTELPKEFELGAILKRADARDAFVSEKYPALKQLPAAARVGTSSLRRQAQLRSVRPDLELLPLRGNVDSRLRKLHEGEYAAVVLALSGLERLQRTELVREVLDPKLMCPAAGQGALAIEIRTNDEHIRRAISFLDDPEARATTTCERAVLNVLGGGCQVPIGVHATMAPSVIRVQAAVGRLDGSKVVRLSLEGDIQQPAKAGDELGRALLAAGAQQILSEVYGIAAAAPQQP